MPCQRIANGSEIGCGNRLGDSGACGAQWAEWQTEANLQRQLASALFSSSSSTIAPFFGRLRDTPEENSIGGTAQHCFGAYLTREY